MDEAGLPDAGDIIWTDFDPRTGREQGGRRPALIVSPSGFAAASGFAIVCPVTRTITQFGTSVVLPDDFPIAGEILTSHVRSIDLFARPVRATGHSVPSDILAEVRAKLAVLCGLPSMA